MPLKHILTALQFHASDFLGYYSSLLERAQCAITCLCIRITKGKEAKRDFLLERAASIDQTPYKIFCEIYSLLHILDRDILKCRLFLDSELYRNSQYMPELADTRETTKKYHKEYQKHVRKGENTRGLTIDMLLESGDITERQLEWHGKEVTEWLNRTTYTIGESNLIFAKAKTLFPS